MLPPVAPKRPYRHELHGDVRPDPYQWLRQREDPEALAYIEAENRYGDHVMAPLGQIVGRLYDEMLGHIAEDTMEPPVQDGPYFYYRRMRKGLGYPIHARRRAAARCDLPQAEEEVVLDVNELAEGQAFYAVTVLRPSPDHSRLAFLENRDASDRYTVRVKELASGKLLPEQIPDVFLSGSLEWDATGRYLYYISVDPVQRPYRLWRHRLGDADGDVLLYEETDIAFTLTLSRSRSGRYLFLSSSSKTTSEVRYLPAGDPLAEPRLFLARETGVEYEIEDQGQDFLVLTNRDAPNFRLLRCPQGRPGELEPVLPYNPDVYLQRIHPFAGAIVLEGREEGLQQLWVLRQGEVRRLAWPEPLYAAHMWRNREYRTDVALVAYSSRVTPETIFELNLRSLGLTPLKQEEVPGYDPGPYRQERLWATAEDGVRVPMSLVYRADLRGTGPRPLILYGYGSYGMPSEPAFDAKLLPLLDRGVVFVTAHVRGGGEMGRPWYEDGKLLKKRNTFLDFIACARELIRLGWTSEQRLAAMGRSAGGLLMGAIVNLAPDLFHVVSAGVPFVDVVSTMLDASIPLTSLEWDEWGNPRNADYYRYMKSYSPYDNVAAKGQPHLYVYTGLNDPRVAYWEPVKWVARLRATKTDDHDLVLKTLMGAGHGGSSGRYARLREFAEEYAFVLHHLGLDA